MANSERLEELMQDLPAPARREVEDFAAFLREKVRRKEDVAWSAFSLRERRHEHGEEETDYSDADLVERWR